MGIYTQKYKIKYTDIDRNNKLSLQSLINYLQEIAGEHSTLVRIWLKQYSSDSPCMDYFRLENKNVFASQIQ